ncbi:MAG: hypothetical protein FWD33_01070 [Alphaproteobacteria bacterium]|nr:hypothetical protein [Alphaproteobacteria bacterium]
MFKSNVYNEVEVILADIWNETQQAGKEKIEIAVNADEQIGVMRGDFDHKSGDIVNSGWSCHEESSYNEVEQYKNERAYEDGYAVEAYVQLQEYNERYEGADEKPLKIKKFYDMETDDVIDEEEAVYNIKGTARETRKKLRRKDKKKIFVNPYMENEVAKLSEEFERLSKAIRNAVKMINDLKNHKSINLLNCHKILFLVAFIQKAAPRKEAIAEVLADSKKVVKIARANARKAKEVMLDNAELLVGLSAEAATIIADITRVRLANAAKASKRRVSRIENGKPKVAKLAEATCDFNYTSNENIQIGIEESSQGFVNRQTHIACAQKPTVVQGSNKSAGRQPALFAQNTYAHGVNAVRLNLDKRVSHFNKSYVKVA